MDIRKPPAAVGDRIEVDGEVRIVAEVGHSLDVTRTGGISPVRYADGSYGLVSAEENVGQHAFESSNPEVQELIRSSEKMPEIFHGAGSDVFHVHMVKDNRAIFARLFYNSKEDRLDEIGGPR